jgi:hypothetical protein
MAVSDASLKVQAMEDALDRSRSTTAAADDPNKGKFFGPMLFAINDELRRADGAGAKTVRSVTLVAVKQTPDPPASKEANWDPIQPTYPVSRPAAQKPPDAKIFPDGVISMRPDKDGNMKLTLQSTYPLIRLVSAKLRLRKDGKDLPELPPIALDSPTLIDIDLRGLPPGKYQLALFWQTKQHTDDTEDGRKVVDIVIRP